ncbi:TetR/AcrR family transcriptional regulator [Adlercreutzia sp. R21]|uniref:TetR/AcrR family transcriptional regulator n=1 Tax=Adlercreutzia wanghongyangiae TaxID=3111451 RepID=UPI002DB6F329|nr:TetR/AcrR family transcriptional regulator [Adlercreutzia sp. R21]MEC4183547.1 TetR/AcrR family transcriptional regulator [Adlercreutzia sp. R21]
MEASDCFSHLEQRRRILRATCEVVGRIPFASVSVQLICDECGISRSSFYRAFSSVKDIAYWYQLYCATLGCYQIGKSLNIVEGHTVSIGLLSEFSPVFGNLFRNWDYDFSLPAVTTHIEVMKDVLREHGVTVDAVAEYKLDGIARMAHRMIERWFNNGMDIPARELAEIIASQYPKDLRRVFDAPLSPMEPTQVASMLLGAAPR